jgi:hypothetical protein
MSKSLDMRFHWLRDRIDQGQFCVVFVRGTKNLAEIFTKALPVARHKVLVPFFTVDDNTLDSINLGLSVILFAASLYTSRTDDNTVDTGIASCMHVNIDDYT